MEALVVAKHGWLWSSIWTLAFAGIAAADDRTVVVATGQTDLVELSSIVRAMDADALLLADSPAIRPYLKAYLANYRPTRVIAFGRDAPPAAKSWGVDRIESVVANRAGQLVAKAPRIVLTSGPSRELLLQAACLAGTLRVPLIVLDEARPGNRPFDVNAQLKTWRTSEVIIAGDKPIGLDLANFKLQQLANAKAVAEQRLQVLARTGPVETVIVTNAHDGAAGGMSELAAWVAVGHSAPLLFTNEAGTDAAAVVSDTVAKQMYRRVENVIWLGSPRSIPTSKRPNPELGKDKEIEMEPLTPWGNEPYSFAAGRLYHEEPGIVLLMLARQKMLEARRKPVRALVASNSGSSLPLLEVFSRNTAFELRNHGIPTTALFGDDVSAEAIRKSLQDQEVFIWEGHHMTMVRDYEMPTWTEPLAPSLVCLQSCLALNDGEAGGLLRRGAAAVVGSSSRTYSASGGSFTLAFFDALLYENQSFGGALRQGKNFLAAYSILKEKHLGDRAQQTGANVRSAWAFTLWGDPTARLPLALAKTDRPGIRHELHGRTLSVVLPASRFETVHSGAYKTEMLPNARLGGLMSHDELDDHQKLVSMAFVEVKLKSGQGRPRITTRLPDRDWVFTWDPRRSAGYILARIGGRENTTIRFHFDSEVEHASVSLDRAWLNP